MSKNRAYIVTFIGDVHILGAFLVLVSLLPFGGHLGIQVITPNYLKLPGIPEEIIRGLLAVFLFVVALGYLRLKRWGYWLMVGMNLFSLIQWIISFVQKKHQFYPLGLYQILIGIIFVVPTIKYFYKRTEKADCTP